MKEYQIQALAELFSAFSDASRLKIIAALAEGRPYRRAGRLERIGYLASLARFAPDESGPHPQGRAPGILFPPRRACHSDL